LNLAGALSLFGGLVDNAGKVVLAGGTLTGGTALAKGATLSGYGRLGGAVSDLGAITAAGGRLFIGGALSGAGGTITLSAGASLELGAAASGPTITFAAAAAALLKLDAPTAVSNTLAGFAAGDSIDLAGLTVTSDAYSAGVLSLFNGATLLGSLAITGTFTKQVFALSSDGAGGTTITLAAASTPTIAAPTTASMIQNVPLSLGGVAITDADAVAAGLSLTVTVSDSKGLLSATTAAGGTVTGVGTTKLIVSGTLAQVNSDLATLTYGAAGVGTDTITVAATDSAGAAATSKTVAVTLTPLAWSSAVSADWSVGADWNSGAAPNGATLAPTITVPGTYTVGLAAGESFAVQSLTINNATATVAIAGTLTAATTTLQAGTLQFQTGGILSGALVLSANASAPTRAVGAGVINGAVSNSGVVEASGGLLTITGAETGGSLKIDNGANLELGAAATGAISFASGAVAMLKLDSYTKVTSLISGMATGDTIDLVGAVITSDQYTANNLALFNGATKVASLAITGSFTQKIFALSSDGAGGTLISLAADVVPTISAPTSLAAVAGAALAVSGVAVADPNATVANETFTVTVADTLGVLTATAAAGGTLTGSGTANISIAGTLAQVNGDLATLGYASAKTGADNIAVLVSTSTGEVSTKSIIKVTVAAAASPHAAPNTASMVQAMAAMAPTAASPLSVSQDHASGARLALAAPRS
jgi:hypothetical protein